MPARAWLRRAPRRAGHDQASPGAAGAAEACRLPAALPPPLQMAFRTVARLLGAVPAARSSK